MCLQPPLFKSTAAHSPGLGFSWAADRLSTGPAGGTQTAGGENPAGLWDPFAGISRRPHPPGPCRTLPRGGRASPTPPRAAAGGGDAEWQRPAWAARFGRLLPLCPPLGLRPGAADPRLLPPSPLRVRRGQIQAAARRRHREPGWGRLHAPGPERGVRSRLPRPGRRCAGRPGGGRSPTAHRGAEGRTAGAGAGRSRCSAGRPQTWKKLSLEALFPGEP